MLMLYCHACMDVKRIVRTGPDAITTCQCQNATAYFEKDTRGQEIVVVEARNVDVTRVFHLNEGALDATWPASDDVSTHRGDNGYWRKVHALVTGHSGSFPFSAEKRDCIFAIIQAGEEPYVQFRQCE